MTVASLRLLLALVGLAWFCAANTEGLAQATKELQDTVPETPAIESSDEDPAFANAAPPAEPIVDTSIDTLNDPQPVIAPEEPVEDKQAAAEAPPRLPSKPFIDWGWMYHEVAGLLSLSGVFVLATFLLALASAVPVLTVRMLGKMHWFAAAGLMSIVPLALALLAVFTTASQSWLFWGFATAALAIGLFVIAI